MTRADLADHYRRSGLPPFQISNPGPQTGVIRLAQQPNEPSAEQLTDRLFQLLDTDKDGKLSRKELESAPAILGKLDIDEDEMLTAAEVMGTSGGPNVYGPVVVPANRMGPPPVLQFLHVVLGKSDEGLAKLLLERYGKRGEEDLPASALGLSKEAQAILDRDGDGKLSLAELARFADKPADVTVTVHLGNRGNKPLMAIVSGKLPAGVQAKTTLQRSSGPSERSAFRAAAERSTLEGATLQFGSTRLDLSAGRPVADSRLPAQLLGQLKTRFRQADTDNDGYLDKQEAMRSGIFRDVFAVMDTDGDGKVSEKEMLAWFEQMESFRKLVDRSCVSLVVSNEGRGLFDLLDSDGDGRLSVRELRKAPGLLARLAAGRDFLARGDVPRHYRGELHLGPNGGRDPFGRQVFVGRMTIPQRRPARGRGPVWFQKMDRNRDGDVSRKEFLGTDEQFKQIDTDGDGLISVEEAEAYDKRQRAERE
jgi:Ca2+-binding EF-hand superfamily protein